ncbi:MAG: hypothetical protein V4508_19575 [Pseudomonadota bacterium]
MKNILLVSMCMLAACSSKPPAPAWQSNAYSSLGAFSDAYLRGDSAIADLEFARARSETASTGKPELVARAELVRCATRVASLEFAPCAGFDAMAQDASPAERAYAAYLAGQLQGQDVNLLPEQHRASAGGKGGLAAIGDPLSQLVAAGVLFETGRITPSEIAVATETASAQGWRRPLLMWLGVSLKRAQAAGDSAEAARIERRIALATPPGPKPGSDP